MKRYLDQNGIVVPVHKTSAFSSLGDHSFLPFTHIGGSIHASQLQSFREEFVNAYLGYILPMISA
jgi:hypothetical protein